MACHGRGSLEQDAERHVGEGSSWLASNGKGAQDTGNRIRVTDPVELLMEGLPNRLRLAGGDQESDQRPSDQGRKLSKATSVVGATVYRGISVVDGWKQRTSLAGEGFRFFANLNSDPKPRTSEMDEGSRKRKCRADCWTLRAAGTALKV